MKCKLDSCDRPVKARQLCATHYKRLTRTIDFEKVQHSSLIRDKDGRKRCSTCKEFKYEFEFHKGSNGALDGLASSCRLCKVVANQKRHGLTSGQLNELVIEQNYCCAICKIHLENKHWNIDHDHKHCNEKFGCIECVRGVLCRNCNLVLGFSFEDPTILENAIKYLKSHILGPAVDTDEQTG